MEENIVRFILEFERKGGGFSFARSTAATLEDTYFAVKSLSHLGKAYNKQEAVRYVEGIGLFPFTDKKLLYRLTWLRNYFGMDIDFLQGVSFPTKKLESAYYWAKVCRLVGRDISFEYRHKVNAHPRYVSELFRQVYLFHDMKDFNKESFSRYLKDCQNGDGGFGFLFGSTSFLELTYYAVKALSILHTKPKELEKCRNFVEACKSKDGGFGRQIHAVPTLESTYHAIRTLKLLQEMQDGHVSNSKNCL